MRHCDRTVGRKMPLGSRPGVRGSQSLTGGPRKPAVAHLRQGAHRRSGNDITESTQFYFHLSLTTRSRRPFTDSNWPRLLSAQIKVPLHWKLGFGLNEWVWVAFIWRQSANNSAEIPISGHLQHQHLFLMMLLQSATDAKEILCKWNNLAWTQQCQG